MMTSAPDSTVRQWYAIYTKPKQEERAVNNLGAWGIPTLGPKLKDFRSSHREGRRNRFLIKHLFPRYIFAHFDADTLLRKVCFTRGVHSVVSIDHTPVPVADQIIDQIRERIREDGYVHLNDDLKKGDPVVVKDGPLSNLEGVFERNATDSERVLILLTAVSYQLRAVLLRDQVHRLVDQSGMPGADYPSLR